MNQEYSYKKTLGKGLKYLFIFLAAALPFLAQFAPPEVTEMTIWELIGYLMPMLKTVTLGSVIVMVLNWLKVRAQLDIP